jgi:hypothetical protein
VISARARKEALFLLPCAAILVWQLFLPGFVGMANNGDFGRVAGLLCMEGVDHGADDFVSFRAVAALLFATVKAHHGLTGMAGVAFAIWLGWRRRMKSAFAVAAGLVLGVIWGGGA